ncbi:serine/threonine protein kinase [Acanthamoeba castellanii str. Neff]|uniref:Serine/threonine protein kinase n=1 Tax=Acanthamoeba castellanii (strain ATCC 30010 / Neff) TaxID=1257118 RepID=L8GTJ0_ACACF|nr:serine/threonine protein kinase [Acanthamoeba castellanii str. Neff]ELR15923.1 serine/threonine protein kinase [Acanthamoeba castellanii str. Neff]
MINKLGVFPESLAAIYAAQMLKGLIYLHEKNVTHRDIKASNILITLDGLVKLADFGIATTGNAGDGDQSDLVEGSPFWMAPEIIQLDPPSTACDIWSLGCTVLELITGEPPYFDMPAMSALFKIVQDDHPPIPDTFSEGLQDFLLCCFKKEPSERATATQLLNHPWIRNSSPILNGLSELSLRDAQSTVRLHNNGAGSDKESGSSHVRLWRACLTSGILVFLQRQWEQSQRHERAFQHRAVFPAFHRLGQLLKRQRVNLSRSYHPQVANSFEHAAIDDVDEWEKPSRPSNIRVQDISSRFEDLAYQESVGYVVLITGFETRKNKLMSYTVFRLKVCLGKETWRIYKTYTDFKDMHTQLRARLKKTKRKGGMPKFPSGKMFGADKEDFVKKRKQKLQTYISEILKIPEVMKTGLLTDFLKTNGQDVMSLGFQKEVEEEPLPERERKPSVHARTSLRAKEKKARQNVEREIGEWTVEDRAIDREEGEQTPH